MILKRKPTWWRSFGSEFHIIHKVYISSGGVQIIFTKIKLKTIVWLLHFDVYPCAHIYIVSLRTISHKSYEGIIYKKTRVFKLSYPLHYEGIIFLFVFHLKPWRNEEKDYSRVICTRIDLTGHRDRIRDRTLFYFYDQSRFHSMVMLWYFIKHTRTLWRPL